MRPALNRKLEAVVWLSGLAAVALADPLSGGLASLCPFDALGGILGLSFCPGCGLGHAVGFLVRGEVVESLRAHPLGIPAFAVLTFHAAQLLRTPNRRAS